MIEALVLVLSAQPLLPVWLIMILVALLLLTARKRKQVYLPYFVYFLSGSLVLLAFSVVDTFLSLPAEVGVMVFSASVQCLLFFCLRADLRLVPRRSFVIGQLVSYIVLLLPALLLVLEPLDAYYQNPAKMVFWSLLLGQSLAYLVPVFRTSIPRHHRLGISVSLLPAQAFALYALLGLLLPAFPPVWLPANLTMASVLYLVSGFCLFAIALNELTRGDRNETALDAYVERLTSSVQRFIPGEFMHQLSKNTLAELHLGDHIKKDMTIFFSDIRAFTELSEVLTPEENFAFINSYFSRMVPLIKNHGGFVDKYMGDGIMALFPAEQGADDALQAAVEMQLKVAEYNGHRAKTGYRSISLGVGIHTGTLMLGVVGVDDHMEGTVVSDAVNLSSRLQSIAKAFNLATVISEATFMALNTPGQYKYRFIGKVRVKGKSAPVSVFEIFDGLPADLYERKMSSNRFFEQGMMAYYQKEYAEAVFYFKRALEAVPEDGAARFYLEICLRKTMGRA
ncbi:MAG: hypothetical protein KKI09_07440 [Spirochaetes bacterium]|nr:hypothetical protein [Spirochaetota bacterium]MBU0955245.1 hypothetical protein [Spirochaetota bacterium]